MTISAPTPESGRRTAGLMLRQAQHEGARPIRQPNLVLSLSKGEDDGAVKGKGVRHLFPDRPWPNLTLNLSKGEDRTGEAWP